MHELLLTAAVPSGQHNFVLKVLAGISASQPATYTAQHLVFRPLRSPSAVASAAMIASRQMKPAYGSGAGGGGGGGTGAQKGGGGGGGGGAGGVGAGAGGGSAGQVPSDLFYLQLVGLLSEPSKAALDKKEKAEGGDAMDVDGAEEQPVVDPAACPWSIEFRDLPDVPGKRPVTTRLMSSIPITGGKPIEFVEQMGYSFQNSYILHGYRFIHNNIQLLLTQTFPLTSPTPPSSNPSQSQSANIPAPPSDLAKISSSLSPIDASGTYLLQASVRVADSSKLEVMSRGVAELRTLKEQLRGVAELEVGDRLAMDTRVR